MKKCFAVLLTFIFGSVAVVAVEPPNKPAAPTREQLIAAMPALKERAKTLVELIESARYLYADRPIVPNEKAAALLTPEARAMIGELIPTLEKVEPWTTSTIEESVRTFAEGSGRKLGAVAQPLRAALTGRPTSPGIFDVLAVLGKDESLARVRDQAAPVTAQSGSRPVPRAL